jgi:hypothetical protein
MDATTFAATRNIKLQQLAARYPNVGFELAQAQHVEGTIRDDSSLTLLAAVILLLPTASEATTVAACTHESAHSDLLELARNAAAMNRQVAASLLALLEKLGGTLVPTRCTRGTFR